MPVPTKEVTNVDLFLNLVIVISIARALSTFPLAFIDLLDTVVKPLPMLFALVPVPIIICAAIIVIINPFAFHCPHLYVPIKDLAVRMHIHPLTIEIVASPVTEIDVTFRVCIYALAVTQLLRGYLSEVPSSVRIINLSDVR